MKITKSLNPFLIGVILAFGQISCSVRKVNSSFDAGSFHTATYEKLENWAAHPQLSDPSDEIPPAVLKDYRRDTTVDVFFLHPTTFTGKFEGRWNADLQDEALNAKTAGSTIKFQASTFNEYNVYAPRYQQAHIYSFYTEDEEEGEVSLKTAYADIRAAFLQYLESWNNGRAIIIAGHSQGAYHAKLLLREFFEAKPLQQQLVAAYIIGLQIEPDFFSAIPVCSDSTQIGCFVGWRTFRKGFEPDYKESFRRSVVVNPLNWRSDTLYAGSGLHKGAILRNFNKIYTAVSDAQIYKDLLWINRPHFPGSRFYKSKNYHIGDINLFYLNIRENLRTRVGQFKKNEQDY